MSRIDDAKNVDCSATKGQAERVARLIRRHLDQPADVVQIDGYWRLSVTKGSELDLDYELASLTEMPVELYTEPLGDGVLAVCVHT